MLYLAALTTVCLLNCWQVFEQSIRKHRDPMSGDSVSVHHRVPSDLVNAHVLKNS